MILLKKIGKKSDSISEILEDFFFRRFHWKLAQLKFRINKFRIIWNIGTFGWKIGKKSDSKFEIWKILVQKHQQGEAFLSKKNYLGFSF